MRLLPVFHACRTRCLFSWVYGDCGSLQEVTVCPSHPSVQQVWGATATCLKHQTEVSDCMLKAKQCLKLVQKLRCAAPEVQSFLTDSSFPTLDAFTTLGPELCETFDGVSSCMVSRYRQVMGKHLEVGGCWQWVAGRWNPIMLPNAIVGHKCDWTHNVC